MNGRRRIGRENKKRKKKKKRLEERIGRIRIEIKRGGR